MQINDSSVTTGSCAVISRDQDIIVKLRDGDPEAFRVIYEQHKRRVFSLCLRMVGNAAIAEELTQDAFLVMFRRIETFRGDSSLSTWLHRVTVNCVLMHLRQQTSRIQEMAMVDLESEKDEFVPTRIDFGGPDNKLAGALDRIALERALEHLPPGYRLVWALHDVEGYEHKEIAELLGCSTGNTKSQLHKARLKLRKMLLQAQNRSNTKSQRTYYS